jgi:hypothetical protein
VWTGWSLRGSIMIFQHISVAHTDSALILVPKEDPSQSLRIDFSSGQPQLIPGMCALWIPSISAHIPSLLGKQKPHKQIFPYRVPRLCLEWLESFISDWVG